MSYKASFITTSREDLFRISRIMAQAMNPEVLFDAKNPLIVTLRGSQAAGKTIFGLAMREELLGASETTDFTGKKNYDEYWSGKIDGKPVQVTYTDMMLASGYHSPDLDHVKDFGEKATIFLGKRSEGGLSIFQNPGQVPNQSLDIWLEQQNNHSAHEHEGSKLRDSSLRKPFNRAAHADDAGKWMRYIEISVHDDRLLKNSKFMNAVKELDGTIQTPDGAKPADAVPPAPAKNVIKNMFRR